MLKFVPMNQAEFDEFRNICEVDYRESLITAGLTKAAATKKAKRDTHMIKNGLATPDNFFYNIARDDGICVGHFWWGVKEIDEAQTAYIYDIRLKKEFRGHGHGREAMTLFEKDAVAKGYKKLGLNVFGYNVPARKLYQNMGYKEVSIFMGKDL
ncbi:MAG: GNAT family N-acetyltransferase [Oligoflexales bacterium]